MFPHDFPRGLNHRRRGKRERGLVDLFTLRLLYNPLVSPRTRSSPPFVLPTTLASSIEHVCMLVNARSPSSPVVALATRNYRDSSSHATQRRGNVVEAKSPFFPFPASLADENRRGTAV